ncbi:glycoside hydrolase family 2 [Sphingomonas sp. KC8]|uniref:glycoside hydrolase family 2 n=1 Tax=Sphingomonas sp. KC8 TaxID=1030157 RepID=UPI0002488AC6|nr:glycoside hydrolase family 2 [Sphingomonas sp. KC8]
MMVGRKGAFAGTFMLGLLVFAEPALADAAPRRAFDLAQGWRFQQGAQPAEPLAPAFDDHSWKPVNLPHSWNRLGEYRTERSAQTNNFQGVGWYRLRFQSPEKLDGKRAVLQFDGVGTIADVWLNGHYVGRHNGAYSRFRFDVSRFMAAKGDNVLVVKADNSKPKAGSTTANVLPIAGDFFPYGGIYRGVSLIVTEPTHIDLLDHAGPGVYASVASVDGAAAAIDVVTKLRNDEGKARNIRVVASIRDDKGAEVASVSAPARLDAAKVDSVRQSLTVPNPRLWQGRADPYLYKVVVELRAGTKLLDRVEQPLGIRTFRMDPDKGFFLNGKSLPLHGVSRHQDRQGKGWALSDADHVEDMDLIQELGANTIRFAHYQHAPKWFELADERGMVVWAEIPYVSAASFTGGTPTPEIVDNARQQLLELVRQNYNHPSVVTWGVGNEVDSYSIFTRKPVKARDLLKNLNDLAKQEDPTRPTTFADCCTNSPYGGPADPELLFDVTDVAGVNRYPGWYGLKPTDMGPLLDELHVRFPKVPLAVSEFGAGAALTQHSDNPLGGHINAFGRPHPEEFQSLIHEESWRALAARPYLWASWVWNMFDFASDFRVEGDAIDLNDKGLVTYDRKTRKDAFYFYKANWSSEPVVHINGRRYINRAYPVIDVRVYSNGESATLKVGDTDLGTRPCPERICVWQNVALKPGENRLVASADFAGKPVTDEIVLNGPDPVARGVRINSGDLTEQTLAGGLQFGSDHFFAGGEARVLNPKDITAFLASNASKAKIVHGARIAGLHDGYREGAFTYDVPLPDGTWNVVLHFFEPSATAAGQRTFQVSANGKRLLSGFDPFAAAGGALKAVERSFPVTVKGGRLMLAFEPGAGPAMVSAIEITRK